MTTQFRKKVDATLNARIDNSGRPLLTFIQIAQLWTAYLQVVVITPQDVAVLMMLLKIARERRIHNEDNLVDLAGYADCIADMNEHLKETGYPEGLQVFDHLDEAGVNEIITAVRLVQD